MAIKYRINFESQVPIYQQLVDEIRSAIKLGDLSSGQQLPTVMQLAEELGLARGTIKRAYDELERQGLVEKGQGRGTFVCYQTQTSDSRKDQAMNAIDNMLDQMEELGFSMTEIGIYLNLKMRERENSFANVRVGVVECNPEILSHVSEQLRALEGIELYSYLLGHVKDYPYNLEEEVDLVVTTVEHADYVQSILSNRKKCARIVLRLSPKSMAQIVKLQAGESVGIVGCSHKFGHLLYSACGSYTEQVTINAPLDHEKIADVSAYLKGKTTVLVPGNYEKHLDTATVQVLNEFEKKNNLIACTYEMDEGSFLYLRERITRLREKKL